MGGSNDENGRRCGFNDNREASFYASFIGSGSAGIFVVRPTALQLTAAASRKTHGTPARSIFLCHSRRAGRRVPQ
jgi:hypothetical protein